MGATRILSIAGQTADQNSPSGFDTPQIESGDRWLLVIAMKESGGTVIMATRNDAPISGVGPARPAGGMQMPANEPIPVLLPPGGRLYFAVSSGLQTISIIEMPLTDLITEFADQIAGAVGRSVQAALAAALPGAMPPPALPAPSKLGWKGKPGEITVSGIPKSKVGR